MTRRSRTLSREVLNATFWNTITLPLQFVISIVTSVLYYQILSKEQVGLIFLLTSLASTLGLYADFGIERALPRYLPEVEKAGGRGAVRRFLGRVIALKLLILFVLIVGLLLLARPLVDYVVEQQRAQVVQAEARIIELGLENAGSPESQELREAIVANRSLIADIEAHGRAFLLSVGALLILGAVFDVCMQFLTAYFKQRAWNLITVATRLLQPVLVTLFLLWGWGIVGVIAGLVITPLVAIVLAGWQTYRATEVMEVADLETSVSLGLRERFARYAGVSYLMQISVWFYDLSFVVFILASTMGLRETAILSFAYKFAKDYLAYVWTPMSGIMTPLLTRIKVDRDQTALRDAHASLTRLLLLLLVPSAIGLILVAPRLVAILYPDYLETTTLITIFIAFTFAESLLSVPQNVLMVYEQYRAVVLARLVALLTVPAVLLLLPAYGLIGVAFALGLVRVASRLVTVVYALRHFELDLPLAFAARVIAATATFTVVLLVIFQFWSPDAQADTLPRKAVALVPLVGMCALGAALYFAVLRLLGGLDQAEKRRLLNTRMPFRQVLSRIL